MGNDSHVESAPEFAAGRIHPLRDAIFASAGFLILKVALIVLLFTLLRSYFFGQSREMTQKIAMRAARSIDADHANAIEGTNDPAEQRKLLDDLRLALLGEPATLRIRTYRFAQDGSLKMLDTVPVVSEAADPIPAKIEANLREGLPDLLEIEDHPIFPPNIITGYAPTYGAPGVISGAVAVDVNPSLLRSNLSLLLGAAILVFTTGVMAAVVLFHSVRRNRLAAIRTALALASARQVEKLTIDALGEILYRRSIDEDRFGWRGNPLPVIGLPLEAMPADATGWHALIHPEDLPKYELALRIALAGDQRLSIEYRVRHTGGSYIWLLDRATLSDTEDGGSAFIGALVDVTTRKNADEALRSFIEQTPTAHLVFAGDDTVDANPAAVRLFGADGLGQLLTTPIWQLWPRRQPDGTLSAEAWSRHVLVAIEEHVHHFEWQFVSLDGRSLFVDVFLNDATFSDRQVLLMACYDLTEARRTQSQLIESEYRFRDVSEAVGEFIWETDAEGRYVYASARVREVIGYEPHEVIGRLPTEWVPKEDIPRVVERTQAIAASGSGFRNFEHRLRRSDGKVVWISASGVPRYDEAGNIIGYRGATLDVTQRRTYEEELLLQKEAAESADRAKSNFLAMMSHEIRTPLNSVIGFADLVLETELDPLQADYLDTIRRSGDALLLLLNDILDFSKIESGRMEIDLRPTVLSQCIAEVLDLYRVAANAKEIDLLTNVSPEIPARLLTDSARLRQILLNLVGNAVKFTASGRIIVGAFLHPGPEPRRAPVIRVTVSDSGIGIKPDQIERLFKPFSQADSSTTRRFGGTGLGLVISKRLAELLGGDLGILETSPDGSVFCLDLPATIPSDHDLANGSHEPDVELVSKDPPELPEGAHIRVLVVDDNPLNRRLTTQMLKQLGAQSATASNASDCFEILESEEFDVVLMDVQMPGMDGLEATRIIREREERIGLRRVQIVALTAGAMVGDREACLDAGMDEYLSKPIRRSALASVLRACLETAGQRIG